MQNRCFAYFSDFSHIGVNFRILICEFAYAWRPCMHMQNVVNSRTRWCCGSTVGMLLSCAMTCVWDSCSSARTSLRTIDRNWSRVRVLSGWSVEVKLSASGDTVALDRYTAVLLAPLVALAEVRGVPWPLAGLLIEARVLRVLGIFWI